MRTGIVCLVILLVFCGCGDDRPQLRRLSSDAVILAFGDSLTHGTGAGREKSYPAVLEELTGHKVINAGVPGEISEQGLQRLPALLDQHQPAMMILCHGGNDILRKKNPEKMQANVLRMIALARDRNIPVILLGVPKFGLFLSVAPEYIEISEQSGVVFIRDLIPEVLSDKALKSDAVHPNAAGYRAMAESIYNVLKDAGAI